MKKKTITRLFLLTVAIFFAWFVIDKVAGDLKYSTDSAELTGGMTRMLTIIGFLMAVCSLYIVLHPSQKIKTSKFFLFFIIWTIVVCINIWFNTEGYKLNMLIALTIRQALIHVLLFMFFYTAFKYHGSSIVGMLPFIVVGWYVTIAYAYSINYTILNEMVLGGNTRHLGTAYVLLYPLPLALSLKNKFWKWFCVIIGAVVILSSIKRGGVLGYAFAMIVYYFVQKTLIEKSKHSIRNIFIAILTSTMMVFAFVKYDSIVNNGAIIERMYNIEEDDGSGRGEVLDHMIKYIPNLSVQELLIGHGFEGSRKFSPLGLTAHNDFLEVLYDYGLLGLIVYLYFYVLIFSKLKSLVKQKSEYAAPLAAGFAILCFLSMISHIIIYPYFAWYAIMLGFFDGITFKPKTLHTNGILQSNKLK